MGKRVTSKGEKLGEIEINNLRTQLELISTEASDGELVMIEKVKKMA